MLIDKHDKKLVVTEKYLGEKKLSDIIYGYYQLRSHYEDGVSYCYKRDCSYKKMEEYFTDYGGAPVSINTLTSINKLLIDGGIIVKSKKEGKSIYLLPAPDTDYVWVKYDTLRFLVSTCQNNVIKVYTYLKSKYEQKQKSGGSFWFTKKMLCEVLGYGATRDSNYKKISAILDVLINVGLIEIENVYHCADGHGIPNYKLTRVNETYTRNEVVHRDEGEEDNNIEIPVPIENTRDFWDFHF